MPCRTSTTLPRAVSTELTAPAVEQIRAYAASIGEVDEVEQSSRSSEDHQAPRSWPAGGPGPQAAALGVHDWVSETAVVGQSVDAAGVDANTRANTKAGPGGPRG